MVVISKINEMMTERGFLSKPELSLKTLEMDAAETSMSSSCSGSEVSESPIDMLKTSQGRYLIQVTRNKYNRSKEISNLCPSGTGCLHR